MGFEDLASPDFAYFPFFFATIPGRGTLKAIGYTRVSTNDQADTGESLRMQSVKIRAMSEVQGSELLDIVIDAGESGKSLRRPGMQKILKMVKNRAVDTVIVYKLDRLTRSVRDLGELLEVFDKNGVSLVSVCESLDTGTAAGRLVIHIMSSVSQWEREVIGERTREALASKKARKERTGNIPFGYEITNDGVHLVENSAEQRIITVIRKLRNAGHSLRAVADELNRRGFMTRRGSQWRHQYVAGVEKAA